MLACFGNRPHGGRRNEEVLHTEADLKRTSDVMARRLRRALTGDRGGERHRVMQRDGDGEPRG
jgi:hypothetical protein